MKQALNLPFQNIWKKSLVALKDTMVISAAVDSL